MNVARVECERDVIRKDRTSLEHHRPRPVYMSSRDDIHRASRTVKIYRRRVLLCRSLDRLETRADLQWTTALHTQIHRYMYTIGVSNRPIVGYQRFVCYINSILSYFMFQQMASKMTSDMGPTFKKVTTKAIKITDVKKTLRLKFKKR